MLEPAVVDTLNRRCDVVVASSSAAGYPSTCWGMAGQVLAEGLIVEAWVREDQARQLLADVRATGRVAAVFSEPFTNFAVQFTGVDGQIRAATREDEAFLQRHVGHMVHELDRVGFGEAFARTLFGQSWSQLAVLRFTASQSYIQTPGPRAGTALVAGAGPAGSGQHAA